jgi:uncharacterized protein
VVTESAFAWSVPVQLADIPDEGLERSIVAGEAERNAIAQAAGLRGLPGLEAYFRLTHVAGSAVRVEGRVSAQVVQTCVVTLEPVENTVDEAVEVLFAPPESAAPTARDAEDDGEGEDPPEPLIGDTIDLARIAVEFLVLGLDPYPRKPGAVFEAVVTPPDPADHPFAALGALKQEKPDPSTGAGRKKPR